MDSLASSRRAAQRHAMAVAAGPPRSARWTGPSAACSALGAAVALPLLRPAGLALGAVTVLLLAVRRQDRRNAWRYVAEPVAPARSLPPRRPAEQGPVTRLATGRPATPVDEVAHVPAQALPAPAVPGPRRRGAVGSDLPAPVARSEGGGEH